MTFIVYINSNFSKRKKVVIFHVSFERKFETVSFSYKKWTMGEPRFQVTSVWSWSLKFEISLEKQDA